MNTNSHIGHAGAFRTEPSSARPDGNTEPTERLANYREQRVQGLRAPQIGRPPAQSGSHSGRTQRTRRTVDLPTRTHRALDSWQREAAERLGVARVTGQEVLTALIDQLLVDPRLSVQVTRVIQQRR